MFLALIGAVLRFLFYILLAPPDLNFSTHFSEIINAFLRGLRFDLSAISYLTLLFIPFIFFKKTPSWFFSFGLNFYRLLIYFWIMISFADILFYSFYTDRINLIAFGLLDDDTQGLLKIFWKNYPAFKIIGTVFVLCLLAYWGTRKFLDQNSKTILSADWKFKSLLIVVLFLLGRGTLSLFPLGPDYAVISSLPFINHLSYGTGHALIRATKLRSEQSRLGANTWDSNLKEFGYHTDNPNAEDQAFEDYFDQKIKTNRYDLMKFKTRADKNTAQVKNVVLIMMESWGSYGILASQTNRPFDLIGEMRTHFQNDFLNLNYLANTPGTAGSLSCVLAGIPQRAISPFLTESSYLNTPLSTSPAVVYKKKNYETHFLYGGNPGWRDINKYARTQGFDFIEGEIEVKKVLAENNVPSAGSHDWGIYDEDLFNYIKIKLNEKSDKNKLYVVMTTTNHPPFELPPTYKAEKADQETQAHNFPEYSRLIDKPLAQKRFRTYRYSSDKLAELMKSIKSSPLKDNTVVGVTGDHSSWLVNFNDNERFTKDAVPFYVYSPPEVVKSLGLKKKVFQGNFGGHMDIWSTLYNLSLSDIEYETFGYNMFDKKDLTFALNSSRLIAAYNYAVFVHSGSKSSYFQEPPTDGGRANLYVPSPQKLLIHEKLEIKYKALMGSLDSYLHHSKKNK